TMHRRTGLLVHLDADNECVARRAAQLGETLKKAGQGERAAKEPISHAIPRRHTETWLCVLTGEDVAQEREVKRGLVLRDFDQHVPKAALALYDLTRPNAVPPTLLSLQAAIPELRRLEP